jgi:hypothetical protein
MNNTFETKINNDKKNKTVGMFSPRNDSSWEFCRRSADAEIEKKVNEVLVDDNAMSISSNEEGENETQETQEDRINHLVYTADITSAINDRQFENSFRSHGYHQSTVEQDEFYKDIVKFNPLANERYTEIIKEEKEDVNIF